QNINYIRYYYSGGQASETYSPHKFTFSKAGYETIIWDNVTVDAPINWHVELQDMVKISLDNQRFLALPGQRLRKIQ
ncbi:MAG TPA: hypothetical protein VMV86_05335, partial [Methanosarcinales archaeon]|nr:hypothetical protein [Methanosarcinales archaeon]